MYGIIKSGSVPNSKHVSNICVASEAKPINTDLNINSNKDKFRRISGKINPFEEADESNILEETLITTNKGVL